jgi:putative ABC transport system permease protein
MKNRISALVCPLVILSLPSEMTEGLAQNAGKLRSDRDKSVPASACVSIWSKKPSTSAGEPGRVVRYGLNYEDLDRLVSTMPAIKRALPIREVPRQIRHRDKSIDGYIIATTHDYAAFAQLQIDRGRFLTADDDAKYENYAVLGAGVAQTLFPEENPIDQAIKIGTDYYTIVGVTRPGVPDTPEKDRPAVTASDLDVYIPLNTCRLRMGERIVIVRGGAREAEEYQLSQVVVQVDEGSKPQDVAALIRPIIKQSHPSDLVGVTPGGLSRQRSTIQTKPSQATPK